MDEFDQSQQETLSQLHHELNEIATLRESMLNDNSTHKRIYHIEFYDGFAAVWRRDDFGKISQTHYQKPAVVVHLYQAIRHRATKFYHNVFEHDNRACVCLHFDFQGGDTRNR